MWHCSRFLWSSILRSASYRDDHNEFFRQAGLAWPPSLPLVHDRYQFAGLTQRAAEVVFFLDKCFPPEPDALGAVGDVVYEFLDASPSLVRLFGCAPVQEKPMSEWRKPWCFNFVPTITGNAVMVVRFAPCKRKAQNASASANANAANANLSAINCSRQLCKRKAANTNANAVTRSETQRTQRLLTKATTNNAHKCSRT